MNELVSIITPSYKSENFISQTIESVLAQVYSNWEMIIVDDVSPDNSNEIIEWYCKKDSRIKFLRLEKNSGPAVARNRAIEEAKGRYIAFLDADDLWDRNFLKKSIDFMYNNAYSFVCSSYFMKSEDLNEEFSEYIVPNKVNYYNLLKANSVSCLTAVYDTKILGKVYMPLIKKRQDLGLWLNLLEKTEYCYGINESLAIYRQRKGSVSSNKIKAALYTWKLYSSLQKINILQKIYYFIIYTINGIRKYKNVTR